MRLLLPVVRVAVHSRLMMTRERMIAILGQVTYRNWTYRVGQDGDRLFLQVCFVGACADSGEPANQQGRKWLLSPHMTKSELVATAFKAVLTAEEHEAREAFKYRGQAVFGPHFDVDHLADLSRAGSRDVRAWEAVHS